MKYLTWIIYWMCNILMSSLSQYVPNYRKHQGDLCEGDKAALVEHFFTVIFSEFRNPPPVCVCVQMCVDQATYCYPNGCLKKMEIKRKTKEDNNQPDDTQIIQVDKKPMFLVDANGSGMASVGQLTRVIEESTTESPLLSFTDPTYKKGMNIYSFGDNYKKLFKYRKLPKVQLQYNLREQVKNTKSNVLTTDVANNRWPVNKMKQVSIGKPYQADAIYEKNVGSAKYFKAMPPITPRYFKRDLKPPKSGTENMNGAMNSEDTEKFSLEKLINDLIESGLDNPQNNINDDKDIQKLKDIKEEIESNDVMFFDTDSAPLKPVQKQDNEVSSNDNNLPDDQLTVTTSTTTLGLLNDTNEISNNKSFDYYEDQTSQTPKEMFKNVYNDDTIDTLSKSIEKLNNTSYELLHMQTFETITENASTKDNNYEDKVQFNKTKELNIHHGNETKKCSTKSP